MDATDIETDTIEGGGDNDSATKMEVNDNGIPPFNEKLARHQLAVTLRSIHADSLEDYCYDDDSDTKCAIESALIWLSQYPQFASEKFYMSDYTREERPFAFFFYAHAPLEKITAAYAFFPDPSIRFVDGCEILNDYWESMTEEESMNFLVFLCKSLPVLLCEWACEWAYDWEDLGLIYKHIYQTSQSTELCLLHGALIQEIQGIDAKRYWHNPLTNLAKLALSSNSPETVLSALTIKGSTDNSLDVIDPFKDDEAPPDEWKADFERAVNWLIRSQHGAKNLRLSISSSASLWDVNGINSIRLEELWITLKSPTTEEHLTRFLRFVALLPHLKKLEVDEDSWEVSSKFDVSHLVQQILHRTRSLQWIDLLSSSTVVDLRTICNALKQNSTVKMFFVKCKDESLANSLLAEILGEYNRTLESIVLGYREQQCCCIYADNPIDCYIGDKICYYLALNCLGRKKLMNSTASKSDLINMLLESATAANGGSIESLDIKQVGYFFGLLLENPILWTS